MGGRSRRRAEPISNGLGLSVRVEAKADGPTPIDIERALIDPDAAFDSPWNVLEHAGLSTEQKTQILRRWEEDAAQVAVAVEEGMPGTESDLLRQILLALGQLNTREGPVLSVKTNGRRP
jgi:hypothetical protein